MNEKYKDSISDKRFPDETYKDYKERQKYTKNRINKYLEGNYIHISKTIHSDRLGLKGITYHKPIENGS